MSIYKVPPFKEPIRDPLITVKTDSMGLPIIYDIQPTALEVSIWVIFTLADGNIRNFMCDKVKVDTLEYDPAATEGKLMIRLADFEITEEEADAIEAELLPE